MKSFIIHLSKIESSLSTALNLKHQLEKFNMPVELFEGTYGNDAVKLMNDEDRVVHPYGIKGEITPNMENFHKMISPGVRGCFYSHYRLWKKCLELNEPIIIFEDDIVLTRPFIQVDWKDVLIVALGHPTKSIRYMPFLESPSGDPTAEYYKQSSMPGCCGYAIKPQAAKKLIDTYRTTFLPADNAINKSVVSIEIHNHIMGIALTKKDGKKSLTKSKVWGRMKSYNDVFESSKLQVQKENIESLYSSFKDRPGPYQFLTSTLKESRGPDTEALALAKNENLELYNLYLKKEKPSIGYSNLENYVPLDAVDSRHIFMNTMIFSLLGKNINKIVEIGGGFGNWARMNYGIIYCKSWTIMDLKFVIDLQRWYLQQAEPKISIEYVEADNFDNIKTWSDNNPNIDLVIAAHSLSEVSLDIFENYLNCVLPNTEYLFYSTHCKLPSKEIVERKNLLLADKFVPIKQIQSEHGKVNNILYRNKKYE